MMHIYRQYENVTNSSLFKLYNDIKFKQQSKDNVQHINDNENGGLQVGGPAEFALVIDHKDDQRYAQTGGDGHVLEGEGVAELDLNFV